MLRGRESVPTIRVKDLENIINRNKIIANGIDQIIFMLF